MTTSTLEIPILDAVSEARNIIKNAAAIAEHSFGKAKISAKGGPDYHTSSNVVTEVDLLVEQYLRSHLPTFGGQLGFVCEEAENDIVSVKSFWLIDGIDGTSHYARGLPFCTIMIALIVNDEVKASLIHNIAEGATYWAIKAKGAFMEESSISVSRRHLNNALISYDSTQHDQESRSYYSAVQNITKGLFCTLSSGYEYCMIASGKLEARICFKPFGKIWDYAPGALLVEEAGGVVGHLPLSRNKATNTYNPYNYDFIASNREVYSALRLSDIELFKNMKD